ncbi:MAG: hypothetical protein QW655_06950 [Nitrososphaerota archaeon]
MLFTVELSSFGFLDPNKPCGYMSMIILIRTILEITIKLIGKIITIATSVS